VRKSPPRLEITGLEGIGEVRPGDDLAAHLDPPLRAVGVEEGDVVAVTQKVVSKAEGRLVPDVDRLAVVARESDHVLAQRDDVIIARTRHGFVCANAGVDASNVEIGTLSLLPEDPDSSAASLRTSLRRRLGVDVAVIITDTFGRAWRRGVVNVAIGCAGLPAVADLRGRADHSGRTLEATEVAVADEVAAASGLVMAKDARVPAALLRGVDRMGAEASPAAELVRLARDDLFPASPVSAIRSMGGSSAMATGVVPRPFLVEAFEAAVAGQEPASSHGWRFEVLESPEARSDVEAIFAPPGGLELAGYRDAVLVIALVSASLPTSDGSSVGGDAPLLMDLGATIGYVRLCLRTRGLTTRWAPAPVSARALLTRVLGCGDRWNPLGALICGPSPRGFVPDDAPVSGVEVRWHEQR
jgi:coenzyme F420-0:L-glutamate ligase/coenzyme F420-1:gamma-L-glutamate ligase